MKAITIGQSFRLYMLTLKQCGLDILKMPDDMIEYNILQEFIIGATSCFSKFTLDKLEENGIIDDDIYNKSKLLQQKVMNLDNSNFWNVESIKDTQEWRKVLELSDEIKALISTRWTEEEIDYLFNQ